MATGFTSVDYEGIRHCKGMMRILGFALLLGSITPAMSIDVTVVGLFPGKAVVVINGAQPRTIAAGQKQAEGVTLLSTASNNAVFDIEGKRTTLDLGEHFSAPGTGGNAGNILKLSADTVGQFWAIGQINGRSVRFLIDTGATSVALPASAARNMGIDFTKGQRGFSKTAGGVVAVWRISLDAVTIGEITLYGIDANVFESGLDIALLGMSFLNRLEMRRDGTQMTLTKKF